MIEKLLEKLVTKFSIKVNDLINYLDISKATIYNYRNMENFEDIPSDKKMKILYLFGKDSVKDLELVLDESDAEILSQCINRITSILKGSLQDKKNAIASIENMTNEIENLSQENFAMSRQLLILKKFEKVDEFAKNVVLEKVAKIMEGATTAEIHQFIEYLEIFEVYKINNQK